MTKIASFDDWIDLFQRWQREIGFDRRLIEGYPFEAIYKSPENDEIEFGEFAGRKKWGLALEIPTPEMRESLIRLIVTQGDTEFASSEQQRRLLHSAPTPYDLNCLVRIMREEMRHGLQMCHILVSHFGYTGKQEAIKTLERRSYRGDRLLGAFNEQVNHWLEFFVYTAFIDRDGKYQLTMLKRSAFAPLAASMGPMLKEESFHLFTGQSGLARVLRAGRVPTAIVQKYLNKWIPAAYDLFGKDSSTSASNWYRWGFKGRFDETQMRTPRNPKRLNEESRSLYMAEIRRLIDNLNQLVSADAAKLYVPDVKFNRKVGDSAGKPYSVKGRLLGVGRYDAHLDEVLPGPDDLETLEAIFQDGNWITTQTERDSMTAH
jgi:benzoyl-CoA 2,3-dioxygenase component B